MLRYEFAQALESAGERDEAVREWCCFQDLHPDRPDQERLRQMAVTKLRALGATP